MTERTTLEEKMCALLESGSEPQIDDFGSVDELQSHFRAIGSSPLLPEFVRLALNDSTILREGEEKCWGVVEACLPLCTNGPTLLELLDLIDQAPANKVETFFEICLRNFEDNTNSAVTRSASLDGAFRFVIRESRLRFSLISALLSVEKEKDSYLSGRVARIIGVAHGVWPEPELLDKLTQLADWGDEIDQVAFEIGACKIQAGLNSDDITTIERHFYDAQYWFKQSLSANDNRHDSAIYLEAVNCILKCFRGHAIEAAEVSSRIKVHVTFLRAWNRSAADPPWLMDDSVQLVYWEQLGRKLCRLSEELIQPSWYETAVTVEEVIAAVWVASKSLLHRRVTTGIEIVLRPRIEGGIAAKTGQLHQLKEWLRKNTKSVHRKTVKEIAERVDAIVASANDIEVATIEQVLRQSGIPQSSAALRAIRDAHSVAFKNMTIQEEEIISACIRFVESHPDYQKEVYRQLFHAVLLWTVRFLQARLEMTKKDEPAIAYLFKQDGQASPKEETLQTDYKNVMMSTIGGTDIEVTNISGGRADVVFSLATERLITEVKREQRDSSFESLISNYSDQAADYQNVSGRLGFVLVLDQTVNESGANHISTLVKAVELTRKGETSPRILIFVKVPGERLTPSERTKLAKKKNARRRKMKKRMD